MVFDETTKSAPYSLLKDFSQRCPLFYLKKGTAWQDLPLNSFLGEFKSPQTRRSSQNIFSKFTLFLKIKKPQQLGTVGVQPTISELLRFSGANDVTRTHDLLITKHGQTVQTPQNSRFPPFPLPRRILSSTLVSIISINSFCRVGHGVGQRPWSSSRNSGGISKVAV